VPVIVDPARDADYTSYRGASVMKPNRLETQLATGIQIVDAVDALKAGKRLCRQLNLEMALVTLDRDGIAMVRPDGSGSVFPTDARSVYDITGAGDMVLAAIGLCLGSGVHPEAAVRLSNVAAGLEVQRDGVAVVSRQELRAELAARSQSLAGKIVTRRGAAEAAERLRREGKRVVLTNGCFDLLHVGHVTYLAEAAALGDALFVGVNSDQSVRRLKGPNRPVIGQADRAAMLASLACVSHVVVFDQDTPHGLLHAIKPDVLVKGGTYTPQQVVGHEVVTAYGGEVRVTGMVEGISTTGILQSLRGENTLSSQPSDTQPQTDTLRRAG